jgi:hypothetical protein
MGARTGRTKRTGRFHGGEVKLLWVELLCRPALAMELFEATAC